MRIDNGQHSHSLYLTIRKEQENKKGAREPGIAIIAVIILSRLPNQEGSRCPIAFCPQSWAKYSRRFARYFYPSRGRALYTLSSACCWVKPKPVDGTFLEKRYAQAMDDVLIHRRPHPQSGQSRRVKGHGLLMVGHLQNQITHRFSAFVLGGLKQILMRPGRDAQPRTRRWPASSK